MAGGAIAFALFFGSVVARVHARACVGTLSSGASLAPCETLAGNVEVLRQTQSSASALAPLLRVIEGNLTVEGDDDTDLPVLFPRLLSVRNIRISRVRRLVGFYALEEISGNLIVQECHSLRSAVFGALFEVGGDIRVEVSGFTQWGFPALTRIGGSATGFGDLDAFHNLGFVGGRMTVRNSNFSVWSFGQCGYINVTASPAVRNLCYESLRVCDETFKCASTLSSVMESMVEVRSFNSLVRQDEIFARRFRSPSYAATVFAPIDGAWYRRKLRAPSVLSAHEARRIIAAHVVSSGKYTELAGNSRLVTDLGVEEALSSTTLSTSAHSITIDGASSRKFEIGGSPVLRARCNAQRASMWRDCLPAPCEVCGYSVWSSDVRSSAALNTSTNLELLVNADTQERNDVLTNMIELDVDVDELHVRYQKPFESSRIEGAVLYRATATNGVIIVVDGTLFPSRIDRDASRSSASVESPYVSHSPPADAPRPSHPALAIPTPPAPKPPPPNIASPAPGIWTHRPPPPKSANLPPMSPPAPTFPLSSCESICSLCDYTYSPGCCCDERCAENNDCCEDFYSACP